MAGSASRRWRGSEFIVRLPLSVSPAKAVEAAAPASAPADAERLKMLVIEDSRDAREMLRMALELEGHDVAVAIDGPQGIAAARAGRPHVIILDIGLPGMDGHAVARAIRKALGDAVVLIALTGYGDSEAHRRTMEAGFDHHVVKPVDPMDLVRLARPTRAARLGR